MQVNGQGRQLPQRQGLPQGSALSPILFLFYIDDLRRVIPENVEVAMFAVDVSLFSSHPNKEVAEAAIQEAITNVAERSRLRKLTLKTSKCEVAFFTNNSKEASWQPSVQLDGALLTTTSLPRFLRVTINRALSFGPHAAAICRVLTSRTSKRWGWGKDQLFKVYQALHLSVINNAAPAYRPWLAPTRLDQPESCQNRALRIITGQLKTTPLEALRIEAGVPSIATAAQQQAIVSQCAIVAKDGLKNRVFTGSNGQVGALRTDSQMPYPRETTSKHSLNTPGQPRGN